MAHLASWQQWVILSGIIWLLYLALAAGDGDS